MFLDQLAVVGVGRTPFYLFKHQAILCGLIEFVMMSRYKNLTIRRASGDGSVIAAAHNAALQEKLITTARADIDNLLRIWDTVAVFRMHMPQSREDFRTSYLLSRGVSALSFARERGNTLSVPSKDPAFHSLTRKFKKVKDRKEAFRMPEVFDFFYYTLYGSASHSPITLERLASILQEQQASIIKASVSVNFDVHLSQ